MDVGDIACTCSVIKIFGGILVGKYKVFWRDFTVAREE